MKILIIIFAFFIVNYAFAQDSFQFIRLRENWATSRPPSKTTEEALKRDYVYVDFCIDHSTCIVGNDYDPREYSFYLEENNIILEFYRQKIHLFELAELSESGVSIDASGFKSNFANFNIKLTSQEITWQKIDANVILLRIYVESLHEEIFFTFKGNQNFYIDSFQSNMNHFPKLKPNQENALNAMNLIWDILDSSEKKVLTQIEKLIKKGIDLNYRCFYNCPGNGNHIGNSVLDYAVMRNAKLIIQTLIKAGADVKAIDPKGPTLLMKAGQYIGVEKYNTLDILNVLISAGADINQLGYSRYSSSYGKVQYKRKYHKNFLMDLIDNDGCSLEDYKKLNLKNVKPNLVNENGVSALHMAMTLGGCALEAVKFLIKLGADPKIKDQDGLYPIDYMNLMTAQPAYDYLKKLM